MDEPTELLDVTTPAESANPIAPSEPGAPFDLDDDAGETAAAAPEAPAAGSEPDKPAKGEPGEEPAKEPKDGTDEEPKADDDKAAKKPSGSERMKRRVQALEAELSSLRARQPSAAGGDAKAMETALEAEIGKPPKEGDFPDYLSFERAATAYELDKRQATRTLAQRATEAETSRTNRTAELVEDHGERLEELEKLLPGSRAKIVSMKDAKVSGHVTGLILESDKSAALALHLAENPDKIEALNRMNPVQAAREVGRLEAGLSLPKPKTATKAPAPLAAVKGGATPSSAEADLKAWMASKYGK